MNSSELSKTSKKTLVNKEIATKTKEIEPKIKRTKYQSKVTGIISVDKKMGGSPFCPNTREEEDRQEEKVGVGERIHPRIYEKTANNRQARKTRADLDKNIKGGIVLGLHRHKLLDDVQELNFWTQMLVCALLRRRQID